MTLELVRSEVTAEVVNRNAEAWVRALHPWLASLSSDGTRRTYGNTVRLLFDDKMTPGLPALTFEWLAAFRAQLERSARPETTAGTARLAPATVRLRLSALRSFLTFPTTRKELAPELTVDAIEQALHVKGNGATLRPYDTIEGEEIHRVIEAARHVYEPARATALVSLAVGCGLRVGELVSLQVGDLAKKPNGAIVLTVRHGKGNKERRVPVGPSVYAAAVRYVERTGRTVAKDAATPLFINHRYTHEYKAITTRQAERIVKDVLQFAGLEVEKHLSPHSFRHSFAKSVLVGDLERGRPAASVPEIQALLGHSNLATTSRYLAHFDGDALQQYAVDVS